MDPELVAPISLMIRTPASAELAWTYLTDPERVADWFTEASPVGPVGSPYRLDFGEGSIVEGLVLEVVPGRRFTHGWTWLDAEPRQETTVHWEVRPLLDGGSEIELIHDGWVEAGADVASRDDHEAYWSGYLDDLRDLLEDAMAS